MKTIRLLFSIAVVTFMLTSCSNDEPDIPEAPEPYEFDSEFFNSLNQGTVSSGFNLHSWGMHSTGDTSGFSISDQNPNDLPIHSKIYFTEGKLCFSLDLTSTIINFHPLFYPLEFYRVQTKFDSQYMISSPLNIKDENKITINDKEYEILSISHDKITMLYLEPFNLRNGTINFRNYLIDYKSYNLDPIKIEKILFYDSRTEALLDIIKMLREYFGDTVDVTPYFKDRIKLNEPVFNLKKIEENILAGNDWSFEGVCSAAK